jgi:hypothetical protein
VESRARRGRRVADYAALFVNCHMDSGASLQGVSYNLEY